MKRVQRGKKYVNGGVVTEHISFINGDDEKETIISKHDEPQGLLQVVPCDFDNYKKPASKWNGGINSDQASVLAAEFAQSMRKVH